MEFLKESEKPSKVESRVGNRMIASFGRGTKDRPLFPARLRDRIATKKHYLTNSRSAIIMVPSLVCIRECRSVRKECCLKKRL